MMVIVFLGIEVEGVHIFVCTSAHFNVNILFSFLLPFAGEE